MSEALDKLIEAVEAGTVYATMGHTMMCQKAFPPRWEGDHGKDSLAQLVVNTWNKNSLDAALALHEALLPGWVARHTWGGPMTKGASEKPIPYTHVFKPKFTLQDPTLGSNSSGYKGRKPACAWFLAILRGYREKQQ